MSIGKIVLLGSLGMWLVTEQVGAQLPDASTRIYTLLEGSQLTDDCPMCDRIPIVVGMTGTFRLHLLEQNPLFTRYEIQNISFHAGTNGGAEYWVSGSGTYQVGGEVALVQDMFLDLQIHDWFTNTSALCVNGDRSVTRLWPEIQTTVDQTNGTAFKVYYLTLVAAPALQFRAITPDQRTGNLLLEWDSNGHQAQLERSGAVAGPYSPISPITSEQAFTDLRAMTNGTLFYRLRQY